jgi:hypothetical protein
MMMILFSKRKKTQKPTLIRLLAQQSNPKTKVNPASRAKILKLPRIINAKWSACIVFHELNFQLTINEWPDRVKRIRLNTSSVYIATDDGINLSEFKPGRISPEHATLNTGPTSVF